MLCFWDTSLRLKSILGYSGALELLIKMMPSEVHLVKVKVDDVILIKLGEKIPTDGIVQDGESYIWMNQC